MFIELTGTVDMDRVHYCERFLELLVDLEVITCCNCSYIVVSEIHNSSLLECGVSIGGAF